MCNSSGSMRLYEFFSTIVISLNSGTIAAYSLVSASLHLLHILCLHLRNSTDNSIQMFIELFFGHKKMDCLGRCGRIPNHKIEFAGIVQCHKVWYHEFTSLSGAFINMVQYPGVHYEELPAFATNYYSPQNLNLITALPSGNTA